MLETKHFKNIRVIQRYLAYVIKKLEKREIRTGKSKSEMLKSRYHVRGMITTEHYSEQFMKLTNIK